MTPEQNAKFITRHFYSFLRQTAEIPQWTEGDPFWFLERDIAQALTKQEQRIEKLRAALEIIGGLDGFDTDRSPYLACSALDADQDPQTKDER